MALQLAGKKKGMTQLFDDQGNLVPCTVIAIAPNVVSQIKTTERDGYNALQLAAETVSASKKRNVSKPLAGHFAKGKLEPHRHLSESRLGSVEGYEVGQTLGLDLFAEGDFVDVTGTSKGKGFQGAIKRHNFGGGPGAHGSKFHRSLGSTGMCSTPGRTYPGKKMPGQMGDERKTVEGLRIVKIDLEKGVMLVKGPVPGSRGSRVRVRKCVKKGEGRA